jgi:RNA polymerase sigma factor (sigma-70 family)
MPLNDTAVSQFLTFQATGQAPASLTNDLYAAIKPMVKSRLRKRFVTGPFGADDEDAIDDTTQMIVLCLCKLHTKDPGCHFDPSRGKGGPDALKAYLFGFVENAVKQYSTTWHNAKPGRKVVAASALDLNERTEQESILKTAVAKAEVNDAELAAIVNECLAELPEEKYRTVLRMNVWEGLSERTIGHRMGITTSKAHRTLVKARSLMKAALRRRGIDESWFSEAA